MVSLDDRILDKPSGVKASPMLKPGDDTRFLSIRKRPMRVSTRFMTKFPFDAVS